MSSSKDEKRMEAFNQKEDEFSGCYQEGQKVFVAA
jgi:hypothetical protein